MSLAELTGPPHERPAACARELLPATDTVEGAPRGDLCVKKRDGQITIFGFNTFIILKL